MCLLVESIKVEKRKLWNMEFHNLRFNSSRRDLFNIKDDLLLENILNISSDIGGGIYKCRVLYDEKINKIEWKKYRRKEIKYLKVVRCDNIDYSYKYSNRNVFNMLLKENKCSENQDILIVKNGRVTDTSCSNIALFNGKEWHTPLLPLLKGTKREELLQNGILIEKDILLEELQHYKFVKPINAMIEFENYGSIPVHNIIL